MATLASDYVNSAAGHRQSPKVNHGAFKRTIVGTGKAWGRARQRQALRNQAPGDIDRIAKDTATARADSATEAGKTFRRV